MTTLDFSREAEVRSLMTRVYGEPAQATTGAFSRDGMSFVELVRLFELVQQPECQTVLEIGMATGTSSVVICEALNKNGGGSLTSVDPFQTALDGYGSAGLDRVRSAGFTKLHELVEQPDYLALPRMVEQGALFDFIFVDGYHSFDYTMMDLFFADLLLKDKGILAIHDSALPAVYHALRYLEAHKPYERISPPAVISTDSLSQKLIRRLNVLGSGSAARESARARREDWKSLAAYRKRESRQAPESKY